MARERITVEMAREIGLMPEVPIFKRENYSLLEGTAYLSESEYRRETARLERKFGVDDVFTVEFEREDILHAVKNPIRQELRIIGGEPPPLWRQFVKLFLGF